MRRCLMVCMLALAPASFAVPVRFDVNFTPVSAGSRAPGTGSFLWDAETLLMTSFNWDFGFGRTGGIFDEALALPTLDGLTEGALLFQNMVGTDSELSVPGIPLINRSFGSAGMFGTFPQFSSMLFGSQADRNGLDSRSWFINTPNDEEFGFLRVTQSASTGVPEPATLSLFAVGAIGMMLARRRRVARGQPVPGM